MIIDSVSKHQNNALQQFNNVFVFIFLEQLHLQLCL